MKLNKNKWSRNFWSCVNPSFPMGLNPTHQLSCHKFSHPHNILWIMNSCVTLGKSLINNNGIHADSTQVWPLHFPIEPMIYLNSLWLGSLLWESEQGVLTCSKPVCSKTDGDSLYNTWDFVGIEGNGTRTERHGGFSDFPEQFYLWGVEVIDRQTGLMYMYI